MYRVCIDVGDTLTECIVLGPDGRMSQYKAPTTPHDPSVWLTNALAKAAAGHDQDHAFWSLRGPIRHLATLDVPVPRRPRCVSRRDLRIHRGVARMHAAVA